MAKPQVMAVRKMVSIPPELAAAIDEFRFAHRFKTEADAIRQLLEAGLAATAKPPAAKPPAGARSKPAGAVKGR